MLNESYTSLKQRHDCHCFKGNVCDTRKSTTSVGAHIHTHVQGTSIPAHTKADRLHHCIQVKPKSVLPDFISLFIPSKFPHDCPTPHIPPSCPTKAPPLSSFQTCPQAAQKGTYVTACETFSAHCPANLEMRLSYSPEKNARFGSKSKYSFLGNHHSQTHRTA